MSTIKNLVKDIIVVQLLIVILWTADFQALPSITISCNLLRFMSIESVVLFNHHMLCYPLPFSFCLQYFSASESFPMSQLFASGCQSMGFSFSISPSNEHSGFISFRIDWFDLLAVQGTLKSLLQHHNKKESVEECTTIANKLFKEFLWMWITVTCFEAGRGTDKIFIANNHIFGKNNPWI